MSELPRARIVEHGSNVIVEPEAEVFVTPARQKVILAAEMEARDKAAALLKAAKEEAEAIVAKARAAAASAALTAREEAREEEHTKVAALYLALRHEEEQRAEKDLTRVVELAIALAERLLGESLKAEPGKVVLLAEQVLKEAQGARKVVIEACPLDADLLQHHLDTVGFAPHAVELRRDAAIPRGSLRITTNLGTLDAQLRPQLERLARTLKDALGRPSSRRA